MNNKKMKKGMSMKGQRTLAYIVLVLLSFLCLFWFYVFLSEQGFTDCMCNAA